MHIYNGLFTSEAVSAGHPDKLCDRISDTILDAYIALDPDARVACETFALSGRILVAGEFRAKDGVAEAVAAQAEELVRQTIREVGYGTAEHDIDPNSCRVELCLNAQSPEIGAAVDGAAELGAGDQGIMFGFACDETPELMPLAWSIANDLVARAVEMNERSLPTRRISSPPTQARRENTGHRPIREWSAGRSSVGRDLLAARPGNYP